MKIIIAMMAVIAALIMVGSGAWPFPNSGPTNSGIPLAIATQFMTAEPYELIYVAEDRGYFAENGLNMSIRKYETIPKAIDGLLNGDVDIAFSGEYFVVSKVFENKNFALIACIDKAQSVYLYGRKDRGIENFTDLRGKKIGFGRHGQNEFFLGRFLDLHGMSLQDVTTIDLQHSQNVDALANGNVDSIVTSDAFIDQCKERLGSNLILWPIQSNQNVFFVSVCRSDWAASHPEQINRFLKSLDQAEDYTINHPAEAKAILQKKMNFTDAHVAAIWLEHQFSLTLDQSLLIAMNDEGRWMINNNLTSEKTLPYFRDYIYTKGLENVKPESVNIR